MSRLAVAADPPVRRRTDTGVDPGEHPVRR